MASELVLERVDVEPVVVHVGSRRVRAELAQDLQRPVVGRRLDEQAPRAGEGAREEDEALHEPFVTSTRAGSTPCRSPIHSRSGGYPPPGPYDSTVLPSRSIAARAQSASSSTGRHSGAGIPRREADRLHASSVEMAAADQLGAIRRAPTSLPP